MKGFWPLAVGAIFVWCHSASAQDNTPAKCTLGLVAVLPLTVLPDGRVATPVSLSGRNAYLTIDTGDIISVITDRMAALLGVRQFFSYLQFAFPGGVVAKNYATVADLKIGNLHAASYNFWVVPDRGGGGTDGLLGPDILSAYDADFDFSSNKLALFDKHHCPGQVVYWAPNYGAVPMTVQKDGHITVKVYLDGKPVDALVDTGAYKSTLDASIAKSLFGIDKDTPGVTSTTAALNGGESAAMYHYKFASMAFADVAVRNPDIDIVPDDHNLSGMPPLVIGINVLRALHLYIAYGESMLYVTAAEAKADAQPVSAPAAAPAKSATRQ